MKRSPVLLLTLALLTVSRLAAQPAPAPAAEPATLPAEAADPAPAAPSLGPEPVPPGPAPDGPPAARPGPVVILPAPVRPAAADPVGPEPVALFPDQARRELDAKETAGVSLARQWKDAATLPASGANGRVVFVFGSTLPSVVCSPLFPTDIELEPGEIVSPNGLHLGDSVRWAIAPAVSGSGPAAVTHLVVKPTAPGLVTSIIVATDRRTYHIKLVASETDWMPYVGFAYPENQQARWAAYHDTQRKFQEANSLPVPSARDGPPVLTPIDRLDFAYRIEGKAKWQPLRVYNDGVRTVLQMPAALAHTEAPALLVLGADGKEQLVNYRVREDRYIVDQVFDRAVLIAGVGRQQQRVTVTRQPGK